MSFKIWITLFLWLSLEVTSTTSEVKTWIMSGYWSSRDSVISVSAIDSTLFTHLLCGYAQINPSTYQISIAPNDEPSFSKFAITVKEKNPSIITLLSIWAGGDRANTTSNLFAMANQASRRNSFIKSSIRTARQYGFQGIDLRGVPPSTGTNTTNLGTLLSEWRAAINSESKNSGQSRLVLTMSGHYSPTAENSTSSYPVNLMERNLDWLTIMAFDYHVPSIDRNFTAAPASLYDPSSKVNTDYGIKEWIAKGFPPSKMILGLAFHGYVWVLANPKDNEIGSPARGPVVSTDGYTSSGFVSYRNIKDSTKSDVFASVYNETYVVNYFTMASFYWFGYDDVEAIRTKVSYAKDKGLLGYIVWEIGNDENWELSKAAQEKNKKQGNKKLFLLLTIAVLTLLVGTLMWYLRRRVLKKKAMMIMTSGKRSESRNLQVFSFAEIKAFTSNFSSKNKIGEGGYGPVYKGKLPDGQEIAVKRLSETSKQGVEEFKNEVTLTAKLQHVNLVGLLGFCTEREEKLLIYEFMPNKSLDFYLYDPARRQLLDWKKWLQIIEGVTQGLLYLQEYSRMTIIHRDLKASNILLDNEMRPKISDFGIAKIFEKDEHEANTSRIVGTYGYVPPEDVKDGIYSTKYDVYGFGVLLLQILSGKKNSCIFGLYRNLTLLEYAYELWKDGKGIEFTDPLLDDSSSSCKIMLCLQVALLCVQEKWQDRPSMLEVSSMLKNEIDALPNPGRPGFSKSKEKEEEEENNFKPRQEICSNNIVTLSEIEPR